MATIVHKNFGEQNDEYKAACIIVRKLKDIDADGSILAISNLSLPGGEAVKDIDIVIVGFLKDYFIQPFYHVSDASIKTLKVHSFCITIELKSHPIDGVEFNGFGGLSVKYGKGKHDVIDQSRKQRDSLRNSLRRYGKIEPYVTNLIWLYNIKEDMVPGSHSGWNILFSDFDANTIFTTAANYNKPIYDKYNPNISVLYSFYQGHMDSKLSAIFELFLTSTKALDSLSRQKFEYITNRKEPVDIEYNGKLNILKGRAGTGKTIQLIKYAYKEVVDNHRRCVLLTYNQALVSDIKRIATFCDFPDGIDEAFSVQTIHSFFFQIMEMNGINMDFVENDFEEKYVSKMKELSSLPKIRMPFYWDYILIDEAQDCKKEEIELWSKLFRVDQIVIADGVDQFVRNIEFFPWSDSFKPEAVEEKELVISKRQKSNIVSFVNAFAKKAGVNWHVNENRDLSGGQIIVTNKFDMALFDDLKNKLVASGNTMYDMLFLVDSTMGSKKNIGNTIASLLKTGIKVFNGAAEENRSKYPIDLNECRLYNYNSCRGIEGWVVVCLFMDKLVEEKFRYAPYVPKREFESDADYKARINREVYKWLLMPLTRAIDKLVITLYDVNSPFSRLLQELHNEKEDYIVWDVD